MTVTSPTADRAPLGEVIAQEQRGRRRRVLIWSAVGIVVLAAAATLAIALRPRPLSLRAQYRAQVPTSGPITRRVTATGRVDPRSSVEVGAQLSGRIATVEVDYNDRVIAGQTLARFDTESLRAQAAQAKASVRAANAALRQARLNRKDTRRRFERSQKLHAQGIESQENLETLEAAAQTAVAAVDSAAAQLELQRASAAVAATNLKYAEVRAPIGGIVITRNVEAGQTVTAALQTPVLFIIAEDLEKMKVIASIDEADMGEVKPSQQASFTVDAFPGREFPAVVTELRSAAKIVQNVVTYEAVLTVDNPGRLLQPGMTASVRIETAFAEAALAVPNAALRFTPPEHEAEAGKHTVWIIRDDELMHVHITPGITDGRLTQIDATDGIEPTDEVLVDLSEQARDELESERERRG